MDVYIVHLVGVQPSRRVTVDGDSVFRILSLEGLEDIMKPLKGSGITADTEEINTSQLCQDEWVQGSIPRDSTCLFMSSRW